MYLWLWNLYTYSPSTGHIQLSGGMTFTLDSDSQYTLTCISTGGPATTVTWTSYSTTVTEGTETVLDDPATAQYTHTLTVYGIWKGHYICSMANDISKNSTELNVYGKSERLLLLILIHLHPAPYSPLNLRVLSQNGLTSLLVSWSPPYNNGLDIVTGYHISYQEQDGGHRGSVMTEESYLNTTITGLIAGATYSISVAANSSTLPSYPTTTTFTLSTYSPIASLIYTLFTHTAM